MKYWQRFTSMKERDEWVELQFMAAAAQRRFAVSKPWGDMRAYDVGIENGETFSGYKLSPQRRGPAQATAVSSRPTFGRNTTIRSRRSTSLPPT